MKANKQYTTIIEFICKENDGIGRLAVLQKLKTKTLRLLNENDVYVKIELHSFGFIITK